MTTLPASGSPHRLLILGEAPGEEELKFGAPFIGASGDFLRNDLFPAAGLDIAQWHITNVFLTRPPGNDLAAWTHNKNELKAAGLPEIFPRLGKRFLHPDSWAEVRETQAYIRELAPDLIIALGGTALWTLTGDNRIGLFRGVFHNTPYGKAIATVHPAAALREYSMRPTIWADLTKARKFLDGSLTQPLPRRLYYSPTQQELAHVYNIFKAEPSRPLGVDIETAPSTRQITVVGFGFPELAICIPIWDRYSTKPNIHSIADEVNHLRWIERFAKLPNPKVLQNGIYDIQWLLDAPLPIRLAGTIDDTMIMHHSQQPELPHSLGNLAALYLNEPSWKQMRTSSKDAKAGDD